MVVIGVVTVAAVIFLLVQLSESGLAFFGVLGILGFGLLAIVAISCINDREIVPPAEEKVNSQGGRQTTILAEPASRSGQSSGLFAGGREDPLFSFYVFPCFVVAGFNLRQIKP